MTWAGLPGGAPGRTPIFLTDDVPVGVVTGTCLNCGKPLGSGSGLCYSCRSEGRSVEDVVDPDEEVLERIERYFVVSSTKCANCEELHGTVTVDGEEYTAADFGIDTLEEWELEMDKEEEWMRENQSAVEAALPLLEPEWPQSVAALQEFVL